MQNLGKTNAWSQGAPELLDDDETFGASRRQPVVQFGDAGMAHVPSWAAAEREKRGQAILQYHGGEVDADVDQPRRRDVRADRDGYRDEKEH